MLAPKPVILFEDPNIIVVNKAPGMLSQGDISGDENLVDWLRVYLGRHYVGLVHRLDRNTSGVMIVAKRSKAAQRLTENIKKKELSREYLALVEGRPLPKARLSNYLLKDEHQNKMKVVQEGHPGAKKSILHYQLLKESSVHQQKASLLLVKLETGRSHQIRAQLSEHGHPLVGDFKYKSTIHFSRPALHSWKLSAPHPITKELIQACAPLPQDLAKLTGPFNNDPF